MGINLQYISINARGKVHSIFNLHGLWDPSRKLDTEGRIEQSKRVVDCIKKFDGSIILCGDFNL